MDRIWKNWIFRLKPESNLITPFSAIVDVWIEGIKDWISSLKDLPAIGKEEARANFG